MARIKCDHCGGRGQYEPVTADDKAYWRCSRCNGSGYIDVRDDYSRGSGGGSGGSSEAGKGCGVILLIIIVLSIFSQSNNRPVQPQNWNLDIPQVPKPIVRNDVLVRPNFRPERREETPTPETVPLKPNRDVQVRDANPARTFDRPREPRIIDRPAATNRSSEPSIIEGSIMETRKRLHSTRQLTKEDLEFISMLKNKCKVVFKDYAGDPVETYIANSKTSINETDVKIQLSIETEDNKFSPPTVLYISAHLGSEFLELKVQNSKDGSISNQNCKFDLKDHSLYITMQIISLIRSKETQSSKSYKFIDIYKSDY